MNLHIDTESSDFLRLFFTDSNGNSMFNTPTTYNNRHIIESINDLITSNNITINDIDKITVTPGPGTHFTRTRIGVTIANALALGLNCLVNGKVFETPIYNKPPNITQPKTK